LKIIVARPSSSSVPVLAPGELRWHEAQLFVGCGSGTTLELLQVQPEGKKPITTGEFVSGYRPATGERLGEVVP
jgi:methionyl-tRNA formyltransferase